MIHFKAYSNSKKRNFLSNIFCIIKSILVKDNSNKNFINKDKNIAILNKNFKEIKNNLDKSLKSSIFFQYFSTNIWLKKRSDFCLDDKTFLFLLSENIVISKTEKLEILNNYFNYSLNDLFVLSKKLYIDREILLEIQTRKILIDKLSYFRYKTKEEWKDIEYKLAFLI